MATNFEFYKDEIRDIYSRNEIMAVKDNQPAICIRTECEECAFKPTTCRGKDLIEWLYAEHIEQPKLTKRERAFCEAVQEGWITGIRNHAVFSPRKPETCENEGGNYLLFGNKNDAFIIPSNLFEWAKHHESISVEDLLKLDVIEEGKEDA